MVCARFLGVRWGWCRVVKKAPRGEMSCSSVSWSECRWFVALAAAAAVVCECLVRCRERLTLPARSKPVSRSARAQLTKVTGERIISSGPHDLVHPGSVGETRLVGAMVGAVSWSSRLIWSSRVARRQQTAPWLWKASSPSVSPSVLLLLPRAPSLRGTVCCFLSVACPWAPEVLAQNDDAEETDPLLWTCVPNIE